MSVGDVKDVEIEKGRRGRLQEKWIYSKLCFYTKKPFYGKAGPFKLQQPPEKAPVQRVALYWLWPSVENRAIGWLHHENHCVARPFNNLHPRNTAHKRPLFT